MDALTATVAREQVEAELLREKPPPGFPRLRDLPLGRYTDPGFAALERERVFGRSWLLVGHECELPEAGSFRTVSLPFGDLVVVRGTDDVVRAFHNACRHRGAPVVRSEEGTAPRLVCQFHSWSYALDGALVAVPSRQDFPHLCLEDRSLGEVRCEGWAGFVFVNGDPDAEPLRHSIDPIASRFEPFFARDLRLVERSSYDIAANWKVVVEAFLEVYHLRTVHATTASQFAISRAPVFGLHPGGHSTMYMPYTDEVANAGSESLVRQIMFPPDLPAVEDLPDLFDTTNVLFSLFPNLVTPLSPQGWPIVQAWPVDVDRTRFDVTWYGPDWGHGDRPAGWETKLAAWNLVLDEDMANLEPIQHALSSAAHGGVPVGYQERSIYHLHAVIDRVIGGDAVPAHLAVPDALSGQVER